MRVIEYKTVVQEVRRLCIEAACVLPDDVKAALENGASSERSQAGRDILDILIENQRISRDEMRPICQDTGITVCFVKKGPEVKIDKGTFSLAINEGVALGYKDGFLRKSVVRHPIIRVNTGDNTPAIIHFSEAEKDTFEITVMPKGAGCENMSAIAMLPPSAGKAGIKGFVLETVEKAWANPCPPVVVGVGIGGNFELAALLSKKALLTPIGQPNPDSVIAALERDLLTRINATGIGPQGLGGTVTALGLSILTHPCHIASLPVAVNMECHAHRHAKAVL